MSVSYKGDCEWDLEDWPSISQDFWGLVDVVTLRFAGRSDKMGTFVDAYKRSRKATSQTWRTELGINYPWATLAEISTTPGRGISHATLTFKGIAGKYLPDPIAKAGTRRQTVTLPYIGDTLGETTGAVCTFDYMAPYTMWRYVTRGRPEYPRVQQIYVTRDSLKVVERRGSPGTLALFRGNGIAKSDIFVGDSLTSEGQLQAFNGIVQAVNVQLDYEEIGNDIWQVTETNEARIIELDIVNSNLIQL